MAFATSDYWQHLEDFTRNELAAGGPDPHMRYVGWMSRDESWVERVWRGGVYMSVYNTITAEVLWRNFPWGSDLSDLESWLAEHWHGLALRRERRAVRTPKKLAANIQSWQQWVTFWTEAGDWSSLGLVSNSEQAYEQAWLQVMGINGYGRYAAFKLIEYLQRYTGLPVAMPDMRPRDGYSPRETLAVLFPEHAAAINPHSNDRAALKISDQLAEQTREHLTTKGLPIDRYIMEVILCDAHQSWVGRKQFPGRSVDSELNYLHQVEPHWPLHQSGIWEARKALNPREALGEFNGWGVVRKELGMFLHETGETWSDLKYDYAAGKAKRDKPLDLHLAALTTMASPW